MRGAIARAEELAASTPNSWIPQQFENPANPDIHEATTGKEIWEDTAGRVDMIVAGVGTGGTITGVTRCIRARSPTSRPLPSSQPIRRSSRAASPARTRSKASAPASSRRTSTPALLTGVETVTNDEAFTWARRLAREEGILVGISSGGQRGGGGPSGRTARKSRQGHRHHRRQLRRAIPLHAVVRGSGRPNQRKVTLRETSAASVVRDVVGGDSRRRFVTGNWIHFPTLL